MCGIVGFITQEKSIGAVERKRWFLNALRTGVVRGDDGTGLFMVKHGHEGSADWAKMGAAPEEFLASKYAEERVGYGKTFDDYRAVIGHNRSATVGSVNTANTHPFQEGPITLVHNGTLNTTHGLPTPKHKLKDADVDSHMICHNLATHSVEDVVKELDGAYALVWHDARDNSVNIIRNTQRPLHILPLKHHKTLLIASEAEMLWWLTNRSAFTPAEEIYYPESGYWLKFTEEGGIKPEVKKLEMHTGGWGGKRYAGWGGYGDDYYDDATWYSRTGMSGRRGEGSNMGKVERPKLDGPHIQQSALNKKVPKPLASTLDLVGLQRLDKLRMRVVTVLPVHGTKYAVVTGRLIDLDDMLTASVYGLMYDAVKDAQGRETWTVAPNGVKMAAGGTRIVLARLLARTSTSRQEAATAPSSTSSQGEDCSTNPSEEKPWDELTDSEKAALLVDEKYYDADGKVISFDEWAALVGKGCTACGQVIDPLDAEEMVWELGTGAPICPECAIEMENNGELDIDYGEAV